LYGRLGKTAITLYDNPIESYSSSGSCRPVSVDIQKTAPTGQLRSSLRSQPYPPPSLRCGGEASGRSISNKEICQFFEDTGPPCPSSSLRVLRHQGRRCAAPNGLRALTPSARSRSRFAGDGTKNGPSSSEQRTAGKPWRINQKVVTGSVPVTFYDMKPHGLHRRTSR